MSRWDALVRAVAIVVTTAGIAGVIGHVAGIALLTRPFDRGLEAPLDAAVCLAVLGVSTFAALGPRPMRLPAALGALGVAVYGVVVTQQHLAALAGGGAADVGLDVATAASLGAQGATLAIAALRPKLRAPLAIASALTLGLAIVSILAYSLDVGLLVRLGIEMPFLVAVALAAHGGGVLAWAWHLDAAESDDPMPSWSPLVAAISAGGLFLMFTIAVEGDSAVLQTALVLGAAAKLATTVHQNLRERRHDTAARRRAQAERARAEASRAEVQEQRRWLEDVLDLAPVPLVLVDPATSRVGFANEAAKALAGGAFPQGPEASDAFTFVDPVGRPLPPDQSPIARVLRGERLTASDSVALTKSGRRELFVDGALLAAMHGQPPVAVIALQDISELRRAQAVTLRLGRLLDDAPTEVYAFDASTLRFVQENDAARRNLGFTSEELRALGPLDLCPELESDAFLRAIEPLRTGERDRIDVETVQRRKDGTLYPVEMRIQMSRSETPPVFVALVENVTARRRTEAERAQLLTRERAAHVEADAARERAAFLARVSRALAEPEELAATLRVASRAPIPRLADATLLELVDEEGTLRRAVVGAGEDAPPVRGVGIASSTTVPLRARGRTLGALTLASTRESRWASDAERALVDEYCDRAALAIDDAQLYDDARAGLRAREEFSEIAANDLRIPISLLAMEAGSLRRLAARAGAIPPVRVNHFLDNAARYAARLSVIVDDLLDPSRVTGERVPLAIELVDLSAVVCNVVARFGERLALAGSPFDLRARSVVEGHWDRFRLEQVVANLLSNAIKYGSGEEIEVTVEAGDDDAHLIVRDHGVGMSPERVDQIFSLSDRAVSARHYGGVGLGLYLVRRIVESMGGTISVESEPGRGSTFTVTLPRRVREAMSA